MGSLCSVKRENDETAAVPTLRKQTVYSAGNADRESEVIVRLENGVSSSEDGKRLVRFYIAKLDSANLQASGSLCDVDSHAHRNAAGSCL